MKYIGHNYHIIANYSQSVPVK